MNIFFDLLILILLVLTSMPAFFLLRHFYCNKNSWERRHKKVTLIIFSLLIFCFILVAYGSFIEPRIVIVREEKIDLPKINKPIKVALISDFQVGPYKRDVYVKKIVDMILESKPDVVLMAGDYIMNFFYNEDEIRYLKPLEQLTKKVPVYAVHGNHEYGVSSGRSIYDEKYRLADQSVATKKAMEKLGIRYLVNELEVVKINGQKFNLFGGDSYWAQKLDLSALRKKTNQLPTITLIHNPVAIFDIDGNGVDLVLAGHTHGGQIRLPFIGSIIKVDSLIPHKWHKGWIDYKNTKMYVTSGVGETGVRARLFTPQR